MNVLFATDVELWPRSWDLSAREMGRAFRQFISGRTPHGEYGLAFQLGMLRDHGLQGVFFVEPLFASVMGREALADIVGVIRSWDQEVQLHLHPEWLGRSPALAAFGEPRMAMSELDESAQAEVMRVGREWLEQAGASGVSAFRAGSFGANVNTLRALGRVGIPIDSSHNRASAKGPMMADLSDAPAMVEDVLEVPQTVYRDGVGRLRHAQVGSSSVGEIRTALALAADRGRRAFVILSHSAELLTGDRDRPDRLVIRRFERLCRLLADHRTEWPTAGFDGMTAADVVSDAGHGTLRVGGWDTTCRYAEQALRRFA